MMRATNFKFQISNLKSRISNPGFQISNFRFQISNPRFRISNFKSRISDFKLTASALLVGLALAANVFGQIASGGTYTLEKSVTAAGGASGSGTSAGGGFTVEGTIGQFGVGAPSQAASYMFYPGFWTPAPLAPTAASVTLGGRVLMADGRGIGHARITLTGAGGETRAAVSSAFGFYRFTDVPAGETYILTVHAKRYTFANPTQIISLPDARDDVDFIAEDNL